jgi:hypothetical protein
VPQGITDQVKLVRFHQIGGVMQVSCKKSSVSAMVLQDLGQSGVIMARCKAELGMVCYCEFEDKEGWD